MAIVGAGPAGLHAAIAASEQKVGVAVFDKKRVIGLPVKCGEYFPDREEVSRLLPHALDFADLFEIPGEAISNECDMLRIFSPLGKCWEFPFSAHVLDRTALEQMLARRAERLGAVFRLGSPVRLFTKNGKTYVGSSQADCVHARVVIAADGFPSTIASEAGLADKRYALAENVAITYQYLMRGLDIESNVTEMYTGTTVAPGGYAWIIPKATSAANVGLGFRTTFGRSKKGREYLDYFVGRDPNASSKLRKGTAEAIIADVLPIDGATSKTYSEKCLTVGDSAGMVMATNGGGILTAMIAGRIAGEVAADHTRKQIPLSEYELRWRNAIGGELSLAARMRRFADVFMAHDIAFDAGMRILRTEGIKNIVTCKNPRGVGALMSLLGY